MPFLVFVLDFGLSSQSRCSTGPHSRSTHAIRRGLKLLIERRDLNHPSPQQSRPILRKPPALTYRGLLPRISWRGRLRRRIRLHPAPLRLSEPEHGRSGSAHTIRALLMCRRSNSRVERYAGDIKYCNSTGGNGGLL